MYLDASSSSSIKADLQTWSRTLEGEHERDIWEDALSALNGAPQGEEWILIFDNADDPKLNLVPFLPAKENVTVILTSRNRNLGNLSTTQHLELGEMNAEEAQNALLKASRRQLPIPYEEIESIRTLLKELGCLAVALVQAGTYCYQLSSNTCDVFQPYTFTKYLTLFYAHRAELMKKAEPASLDNYERGAYTTLDLSYKALPPACGTFLHLISFLHHTAIPLEVMAVAARSSFKDPYFYLPRPQTHGSMIKELTSLFCTNGEWNELQVQGFISTLRSFSLLTANTINDAIYIHLHPLIQTWSRDMDTAASQYYRKLAIQVLVACRVEDNIELNQYILPHALEILDQIRMDDLHVNELAAIGALLGQQGLYRRTPRLFEVALKIMKSSPQADPLKTLSITSNLGTAYRKEGNQSKAEELALEVLEQRKRLLGEDSPGTLREMQRVSSSYSAQGRYSEAEALQAKALEDLMRTLGPEAYDTMNAASNLATTYFHQKRWKEAQGLLEKVLDYRRRTLGEDHPKTIHATGNLASAYCSLGRWHDAERLELEVLEYRKRVLGPEHPTTIRASAALGLTYSRQGRLEDSLTIRVPTVQLAIKVLGQEHPHTQIWIKTLAQQYVKMEKWAEYEEMSALLLSREDRAEKPKLSSPSHQSGEWEVISQSQSQEVISEEKTTLLLSQQDTLPSPLPQTRSNRLFKPISRLLGHGKRVDKAD